jgi:hypothetical protein
MGVTSHKYPNNNQQQRRMTRLLVRPRSFASDSATAPVLLRALASFSSAPTKLGNAQGWLLVAATRTRRLSSLSPLDPLFISRRTVGSRNFGASETLKSSVSSSSSAGPPRHWEANDSDHGSVSVDRSPLPDKSTYPITPPRQLSVAVQRDEIMKQASIGSLNSHHIELLSSGIEALCRINARHEKTSREKIQTAERYLYRWIQEVNWVASQRQQQQQQSQPPIIRHQRLVIPLKIWKGILLACANLPLPAGSSHAGSNGQSSDRAVKSSSLPLPSTQLPPAQYPFQAAYGHLQHMIQLHQMYPSFHLAPTEIHYSTVLYACSNCSAISTAAVNMAEALIRTLEETALTAQQSPGLPMKPVVSPTVEMYNNVILAHANRAPTVYGAAAAAEDWLMHMSAQASDGRTRISTHPDTRTFNRVLKAWCNSPEEQGGNRAADILHLMLEIASSPVEHGHRVGPDVISFGTVITAFAKRRKPEQCQALLEEAVRYFYKKTGGSHGDDLTQCWNATLFAWAQSGDPDAPKRVESLISEGIQVSPTQFQTMVRLDTATYAACIDAHLQSNLPNRFEKAEAHLLTLVENYRKYLSQQQSRAHRHVVAHANVARPTTREFDTVIHAWYRSLEAYEGNLYSPDRGRRRPFGYTATRATSLLRIMIDMSDAFQFSECAPATGTCNMCIESWCKTVAACHVEARKEGVKAMGLNEIDNDIAERARAYQKEMKEQAMEAVAKAVSVLDIAEKRRLTNDFSYSIVINALCKIGDPNCSLVAAKILERWERETDQRDLPWPSTAQVQYSSVIAGLAKVGTVESAEMALRILRGIPNDGRRYLVDKGSLYAPVLGACSLFPGATNAKVAQELFEELVAEDKNPSNNLSLYTQFCERVLWALASTKDKASAALACEVLILMLDRHGTGQPNMEPSAHCFNACIQSLTECGDVEYTNYAVNLIRAIVSQFDEKKLSQLPSPAAFYKVIKACNDIGSHEMIQNANDVARVAERLMKSAGRWVTRSCSGSQRET